LYLLAALARRFRPTNAPTVITTDTEVVVRAAGRFAGIEIIARSASPQIALTNTPRTPIASSAPPPHPVDAASGGARRAERSEVVRPVEKAVWKSPVAAPRITVVALAP